VHRAALAPLFALLFGLAVLAGCSLTESDEGASNSIVRVEPEQSTAPVATSVPTPEVTVPPPTQVAVPTPVPTVAPTEIPTAIPTTAPTVPPTATVERTVVQVATAVPTETPVDAEPTTTVTPQPVPSATGTPQASPTATNDEGSDEVSGTGDDEAADGNEGEGDDAETTVTATPTRPPLTPDAQVSAELGLGFPPSGPDPTDADNIYPNPDYDGEVRAVRTNSGVVMAVRAGGFGTYDAVTPCHRVARVYGAQELTERVDVLIDPGHGGSETGAVGANGLTEAAVNLSVSLLLLDELEQRGFSAELTRYGNHRVAIQSRAALANALNPRVFISVHHNGGFPLPFDKPGHEIFFQKGDADAQRLGGLVFEEFDSAFGDIELDWVSNGTRGVSWRTNTRGTDLYGVLRRTPGLVTILTEAMFLTNPPEAQLLAQPAILEAEAQALANAIERYFVTTDQGTGFIEGLIFRGDFGPGGGAEGCVDPILLPSN